MVKNLKQLRKQAGMSQQQLADVVNVSQQSINKYENHDVEPNIGTLIEFAKLFDTSVDYLIGITEVKRKIEIVEEYALNTEEKRLVDSYRRLCEDDRMMVMILTERLKKK